MFLIVKNICLYGYNRDYFSRISSSFSDITYMNISDAAKVGDLETLKSAFARGISANQRDKYYKTPLMSACAHGNIDVAVYLLQIG